MKLRRRGSALDVDVAVVGAGAAGLYAALCAASEGAQVALISTSPLAQTASYWAQGGLAAALGEDDSVELHLADTEKAGRGAVRRSAAELLVRQAPQHVADLQAMGVQFDVDPSGRLALGLEGGHSIRRVVHAGGSATGRRMLRQLSVLAVHERRIAILEGEGARVQTLIEHDGRCMGVACSDGRTVLARSVILSTGGAAAMWARTTNPPGSLGAGLLLAHAAGALLADLEFVQFHPTAVIGVQGREGFLITEAIRGEGATLHDSSGERFIDELAPRDEVSRAIHTRLSESGERSVGLDMRAIDPSLFPNVVGALRESGLDTTHELVPVAPAAHYMIGGIVTDLDGRSTVPGLYAIGEVSCTGLHGANRLASNSLSECFVFGRRAALSALAEPSAERHREVPEPAREAASSQHAVPSVDLSTREALWRCAGVERRAEGLKELEDDPHPLARLIARSALTRQESRGVHARVDFPRLDDSLERAHLTISACSDPSWQRWE